MTHDETVGFIPEFVDGALPESEHQRMRLHVDACDDCRSLAEGYGRIAAALRSGAADHPSSEELVAFATGLTSLDPASHLRVARHLEACGTCAQDVDTTREAERSLASAAVAVPTAVPGRPRASWRGLAAAALIGGVVVGYPLYRTAGRRDAPWSGAVGLTVVPSTLRGNDASVVRVAAPEGQPFVAFAVPIPQDPPLPAGVRLAFSLVDGSGATAWRQEIDSSRLGALTGASGAVLLVVPSSAAEPGRYVVRLTRAAADGGAPLLEAPLEIVR